MMSHFNCDVNVKNITALMLNNLMKKLELLF